MRGKFYFIYNVHTCTRIKYLLTKAYLRCTTLRYKTYIRQPVAQKYLYTHTYETATKQKYIHSGKGYTCIQNLFVSSTIMFTPNSLKIMHALMGNAHFCQGHKNVAVLEIHFSFIICLLAAIRVKISNGINQLTE